MRRGRFSTHVRADERTDAGDEWDIGTCDASDTLSWTQPPASHDRQATTPENCTGRRIYFDALETIEEASSNEEHFSGERRDG